MVLLDLSPKEGKFEALKGTLPNTRSYDGCLDLKMCVYEDENKVCLVEEWETKEHQQTYFAWRESTGALGALLEIVDSVETTYMNVEVSY